MEEEENRLGRRGRAWGGFLEEVMLELNLKTEGGVSPKEGILVDRKSTRLNSSHT